MNQPKKAINPESGQDRKYITKNTDYKPGKKDKVNIREVAKRTFLEKMTGNKVY